MKKTLKAPAVAAVVILAFAAIWIAKHNGAEKAGNDASVEVNEAYSIKYSWPEKPKVGHYILKVNVYDKAGKALKDLKDIEATVSYDMPSMRGHHAESANMKLSAKGDFLLPIHFAMRGDWEIIISVKKDGHEIAGQTISLDI
ncbi:MAG: FixH family protein [Elusimicrobiota bacterium]|jgi:hypothetical protein|nr:FixH family protein [Elusimicrobiota bacterium]